MKDDKDVETDICQLVETSSTPMRRQASQSAFSSMEAFEASQRMAIALSKSSLVPDIYQGNVPNCLLALEMSQRLEINPLMVMQNMYIVHKKPSWSSQFMIACVNESGLFSSLRYDITGKENTDDWGCVAWAIEKSTGERLESARVTIKMAKSENWYDKAGSKWKTMPALMMRYRSATFFARTYCPQLTMGFSTKEELIDIGDARVVGEESQGISKAAVGLVEKAAAAVVKTSKKVKADAKADPEYNSRLEWIMKGILIDHVKVDAVLEKHGYATPEDAAKDAANYAKIQSAITAAIQ